MTEKEVAELRRRFRADKSNIPRVYGCYVNGQKEIISEFDQSIAMMGQEEAEMLLATLRRTLSGMLGKNLMDIEFTTAQVADSDEHRLLMTLRNTELHDPAARRKLYQKAMESLNLDDIAGIRVICSFIDDIYAISEMLARQDDIKVIAVKDYIRCPKANGYRSYHMIIEVPVFFSNSKKNIRVEVQIRTIAMDFWASLDHQLKYKKQLEEQDAAEIGEQLRECAEVIAKTDWQMLDIRQKIEEKGILIQK